MLLKNLISNIPKEKKIEIRGLASDSNKIKRVIFFLQLKAINLMVKNILTMQSKKELW